MRRRASISVYRMWQELACRRKSVDRRSAAGLVGAIELAQQVIVLAPSTRLYIGCTLREVLEMQASNFLAERSEATELVSLILSEVGIAATADSDWVSLSSHEKHGASFALAIVGLWSLPSRIRLVVVDGLLDKLSDGLRVRTLDLLRRFALSRRAAVVFTTDRHFDDDRIDHLFVVRHEDALPDQSPRVC